MIDQSNNIALTSNLELPLLFPGQAQKEFFLNSALVMIDAVLGGRIKASLSAPPTEPVEGSVYRVLPDASGSWLGQRDKLAIRVGGTWHFIAPSDGMQVYDEEAGVRVFFWGSWSQAERVSPPNGGPVIDSEARASIRALIQIFELSGVFTS